MQIFMSFYEQLKQQLCYSFTQLISYAYVLIHLI